MTGLLVLALVGGILALDGTSVGQFMVSRPLVAGVIAGAVVGDPGTGLLVGAILELYLLVSFPTGGARFPEAVTGTLVAVVAVSAVQGPGALPLGVAFGLVWGQVGGLTITGLRHLNARIVPEPGTSPGPTAAGVARVHLLALGLDFLRGVSVTAVGLLLAPPVVAASAPAWPLAAADSLGLLLVGGAASVGIFLRSVGGYRARSALFLTGILLGLLGGGVL